MKSRAEHEDFTIVPTDFIRIEQDYREFDDMDAYENFTLELYDFLIKEFPNAYFNKGELYPESIGCDIQYLKGDPEELFEILRRVQEEFKIPSIQIETDLFETKRDEILEAFVNRAIDLDYDTSVDFIHVRQVIQHLHFTPDMSYEDFRNKTETFSSTIIHAGLALRSEFPRRFVPPYLYSEIRTSNIED
jgi:hypothetical protein